MGLAVLLTAAAAGTFAKTTSVVTFNSEEGIVLLDSLGSKAAYRLFESLNVPVEDHVVRQTKIFAPDDGTFRIVCSAFSASYVCAVVVYAGEFATLDFDRDEILLELPGHLARRYAPIFPAENGRFRFRTEDGRLTIDWSPEGLRILAPGQPIDDRGSERVKPEEREL